MRTERVAKQKQAEMPVFVCKALISLMSAAFAPQKQASFKKSREDPCSAHHKKAPLSQGVFLWADRVRTLKFSGIKKFGNDPIQIESI